MRSAMHRHRRGEQGAATVEFALLTLILVPTLLYAIYFHEVGFAKIKANEAARYMVWEMTAYGLSDWKNQNHDGKFNTARSTLLSEIRQRYGDDLDGATGPSPLIQNHIAHKPMTIDVVFESNQATLENLDPGIFTVGTFTGLNGVASQLFGFFEFNQKGKVKGSFRVTAKNKLLGRTMPVFFTENMLMTPDLDLSVTQSLIADQWDLKDGRPVNAMRGHECDNFDYCKQVDKMAFFGINNYLGGVTSGLGSLFSAVGIHWPFDTVVRSYPLSGQGSADSSVCLSVNNASCSGHTHHTVKKAYTNAFKDTHDRTDSDYYKVYQKTGPHYLGCNEELKQDGKCDYSDKNRPLKSCN